MNACSAVPVLLPSSIMRIMIVPRWRTSPALAGTKFRGTLGVSISCCAMTSALLRKGHFSFLEIRDGRRCTRSGVYNERVKEGL